MDVKKIIGASIAAGSFIIGGIAMATRKKYDEDGYDKNGYDKNGYDRNGYNQSGYDKNGYDRNGYNQAGYDKYGYDRKGYNRAGYNTAGYNQSGYDREGYNQFGYDRDGYDRKGYNKDGYNRDGYNQAGYDQFGCDRLGYTYEDVVVFATGLNDEIKKARNEFKLGEYDDSVMHLRKVLENLYRFYIQHYHISSKNMDNTSFEDCINICKKSGFITEEKADKLHSARRHGNDGAHSFDSVTDKQAYFSLKLTEEEMENFNEKLSII